MVCYHLDRRKAASEHRMFTNIRQQPITKCTTRPDDVWASLRATPIHRAFLRSVDSFSARNCETCRDWTTAPKRGNALERPWWSLSSAV